MPAKTTKSSKAVTSKSSKRVSTPLGILIVVAVGLLLGIVGTLGYNKYKEKDLQAKAGSYTKLPSFYDSGITLAACKKPGSTASEYRVTLIATKSAETQMLKKFRAYPKENSQNPVYAVYFPVKESLPSTFEKFKYKWSRSDSVSVNSKTQTPWWGGVVNMREKPAVPSNAKIAVQGGSDLGGLRHYDGSEYEINLDKIIAPNFSDYWSEGGNVTKQSATWLKTMKAWENRTLNVSDLADC